MEDIQTPSAPVCASCSSTSVVEGFSTPLCRECRQRFIKYPIPKGIKIFAGIIIAIIAASLIAFPRRFTMGLHIEKGKRALEERKYLTARREFTPVAAAYPDNAEWQAYLMIAAFYSDKSAEMEGLWHKLEGKVIDDQELLYKLNLITDKFEAFYPSESFLALQKSYSDNDQALPDTACEGFLRENPAEVYAAMTYVGSLFDQHRLPACDSVLKIILEKDGSYWPALRMASVVQRELGNYDEAIRYCDQLLKINQEAAFTIAAKARIMLKQHRDKEGLKYALESVAVDKDEVYCSATLALAYHFNNQPQQRDNIIHSLQQGDSLAQEGARRTLDEINQEKSFRN